MHKCNISSSEKNAARIRQLKALWNEVHEFDSLHDLTSWIEIKKRVAVNCIRLYLCEVVYCPL